MVILPDLRNRMRNAWQALHSEPPRPAGARRQPAPSGIATLAPLALLAGLLLPSYLRAQPAGQPAAHPTATAATAPASVQATPRNRAKSAASLRTTSRGYAAASRIRKSKPTKPTVIPARVIPPAEQAAKPATILYNQGELSVDAQNSSLRQILSQIAAQTGLRVEGLTQDERIYGKYGPGPLTSTVSSLLDGSGYNYVIIGDIASHSPVSLVLTPRSNAPSQQPSATPPPATASNQEPAPPANAEGAEGTPSVQPQDADDPTRPKTPQEIFDELRKIQPQ